MSILDVMKKNAVMLQKPSLTIAIRVDLNAVQRKFYDALLFVAKQDLKKDKNKKTFTVPFLWLKEMLSENEKNKNNKYYIDRLKEIKKKDIEFNILNKEKGTELTGLISLVSALYVEKVTKTGEVRKVVFELPEGIKNALLDPKGIYANINLVVIRGLSSKYALILYEIAKDYEKVEIPEMTIEDFRKIFGIFDKYPKMPDLKRRVLDVAVNELNDNENIDFLVSYELRKTGRFYTHIKFYVKPKPAKLKLDQQKDKIISEEIKENPDLSVLLALVPEEYRTRKNLIAIVLGGLEEKGKEYVEAQIEYTNKNAKKNYVAYLKKAIESDYAGVEVIEGAVIEEKDEWKKKYLGKKIKLKGEDGLWEIVFVDEPDDEGMCRVRVKDKEGREVWAVIRV